MASDAENSQDSKLADLIETSEIANLLNFDLDATIGLLLESAAKAVNSEGASILIRRDESRDLFFLKATGQVADQLEGVELPAGKGVAGFVAASGQPMAVSDVGQEESFYAEIDRKTGFSTEILLATPLFFDGEILGVLEFINRPGDPPYEPFTPDEMDTAAVFAEAIAALVNNSLVARLLNSLTAEIDKRKDSLAVAETRHMIETLQGKKLHKETLELAVLVKAVSDLGDGHRRLCRSILESIIDFSGASDELDYSDV